MKKNSLIYIILNLIGTALIIAGILMTVIPLFNFNGQTFKLIPALMSGILLPLVGIIIIVISTIANINIKSNQEIEEISAKAKEKILNDKSKDTQTQNNCITCKYCGCKSSADQKTCSKCGAKIK